MINIIINVSPSLLSTFWHPPELEKIVPSKAPIYRVLCYTQGFPGGSTVKHLPATTRDKGSIPESRRSPRVGNSNPRQYSCLENSMGGGACRGTVHGVNKGVRHDWGTKQQQPYSKGREENLPTVLHIRDLIYSVLLHMPRRYLKVTEQNAVQYKELWSLIFFILPHHTVGGISAPWPGIKPHPLY